MNERLLQFIWQFRYYNQQELQTTNGETLTVLAPGDHNAHQGPDFSNARIKIGNTIWAGAVELHLNTSDWNKHGHQIDEQYHKIILHVVWNHDLHLSPGEHPILELKSRVSVLMLEQYDQWMFTKNSMPCKGQAHLVNELIWSSWKDRMLTERLQQKRARIHFHLQQTNQHWEEVFWRMLCRYFGMGINAESFEQIAISLPLQILAKHKNQIHQLEALLLGQAGILHKNLDDSYSIMLYKEYQFLQKKYGLRVVNKPPLFLRLRPVNFPSVRLAQLAMLIQTSQHLFSKIREAKHVKEVYALLDVTANDYWSYHYKPGILAEHKPKRLGNQTVDVIIVNAIAPMLFAYGQMHSDSQQTEKAIQWLQKVPAEINSITKEFKAAGITIAHAHDSQAILYLKKEYCDARRCLECAVGNGILKSSVSKT